MSCDGSVGYSEGIIVPRDLDVFDKIWRRQQYNFVWFCRRGFVRWPLERSLKWLSCLISLPISGRREVFIGLMKVDIRRKYWREDSPFTGTRKNPTGLLKKRPREDENEEGWNVRMKRKEIKRIFIEVREDTVVKEGVLNNGSRMFI